MKLKLMLIFNLWLARCSLASDSVKTAIAVIKKFTCSDCDYAASKKCHLTAHVRTHTGEKPFVCPQCSYAAAKKSDLTRHIKTHKKRKLETEPTQKVTTHGGAGYEEDFGEDPDQLESLLDLTKIHNVAAEVPDHWSDDEIE